MNRFILIGAVTALGLALVVAVAIQGDQYRKIVFPDEEEPEVPDVPEEPEDPTDPEQPSEPTEHITTLQMWARDDVKDAVLNGASVLEVCRVGNGGTSNISIEPLWVQTVGDSVLDVSVHAEKFLLLPDESVLVYIEISPLTGDLGLYEGYVDLQPSVDVEGGGNPVLPGGLVNVKVTVVNDG